jgi:hypothetical protein
VPEDDVPEDEVPEDEVPEDEVPEEDEDPDEEPDEAPPDDEPDEEPSDELPDEASRGSRGSTGFLVDSSTPRLYPPAAEQVGKLRNRLPVTCRSPSWSGTRAGHR